MQILKLKKNRNIASYFTLKTKKDDAEYIFTRNEIVFWILLGRASSITLFLAMLKYNIKTLLDFVLEEKIIR